jgi:transposase
MGLPCRPVTHSRRRIVDAILYVARTGCAWRQLPHDFPSWKTVYWYFTRWNTNGTLDHLHNALREKVRIAEGRNSEPTAGIVDAQSIRGADTVGKNSRGYDAGKKVNGRKRNIVVDTIGMLLIAVVTAANVQDRKGGNQVIEQLHKIMPSVRCIWADGGYAGLLIRWARTATAISLEIVRKPEGQKTFEVLPNRWVVERTFAWLMRWRRLRCDYERSTATSEAMMKWAMVGLMTRRLARSSGRQPWSVRRAA